MVSWPCRILRDCARFRHGQDARGTARPSPFTGRKKLRPMVRSGVLDPDCNPNLAHDPSAPGEKIVIERRADKRRTFLRTGNHGGRRKFASVWGMLFRPSGAWGAVLVFQTHGWRHGQQSFARLAGLESWQTGSALRRTPSTTAGLPLFAQFVCTIRPPRSRIGLIYWRRIARQYSPCARWPGSEVQ